MNSAGGNIGDGYWYLERPGGELEAICGKQHGTDHNVPIHWTPAPTAREWEEAKNAPTSRPRSPVTVGVALFALALVALAVYSIIDAIP